jgi:hypothetical protein
MLIDVEVHFVEYTKNGETMFAAINPIEIRTEITKFSRDKLALALIVPKSKYNEKTDSILELASITKIIIGSVFVFLIFLTLGLILVLS